MSFYHNNFERVELVYQNIFNQSDDPIEAPELMNDYDSMAEAFILKMYLEAHSVLSENIYQKTIELSKLITLSLNNYNLSNRRSLSYIRRYQSNTDANIDPFRRKSSSHSVPSRNQTRTQTRNPPRNPPRNPSRTPLLPKIEPITEIDMSIGNLVPEVLKSKDEEISEPSASNELKEVKEDDRYQTSQAHPETTVTDGRYQTCLKFLESGGKINPLTGGTVRQGKGPYTKLVDMCRAYDDLVQQYPSFFA
jgi:hypothetical protein